MEILLTFLGYLIFNVNSSIKSCEDLKYQPFITCYSYISSCYILEGDNEDYSKLQHIETQIIKPSFIIPLQEQPIVIRIIDNLDEKKKIQEKLLCYLFSKIQYSIVCISFDLVIQNDQVNFIEKLRFDTNIVASEDCKEMNMNEDGSLNLFCLSKFKLKQYTLYLLRRNVTLNLEHNVQDQIQDSCQIKQMKWKENQYIIAFYQCSNWKILLINNSEVQNLLDAQMKENETFLQGFSYIHDVSFCMHNQLIFALYLIENDSYLQVNMNSLEKKFANYFSFENTKRILKIIVQQTCQIIIIVYPLQDNKQKVINYQTNKEINLNQKYQNHNIYFHSNLLFLQNQSELNILLNAHLNQTYQINNTPLHFFEFIRLFCQFDQTKNTLQFYRYFQLSSFIQPKKKYLFLIQNKDLFKSNTIYMCLRIIYENNTLDDIQTKLVQKITMQNNCQSKLKQIIWKTEGQSLLKNSQFNLYNHGVSINVSIRNNDKFVNYCLSKLQLFNFIGNIEVRQIKIPGFICFQNETQFFIYNCNENKLQISINKEQFEVLESYGDYIVVSKNNKNLLRIIQLQNDLIFQFKIEFDDLIIKAQQISQSVFLYMNNSNLPPLIYSKYQSNFNSKYLLKSLYQSEPILFYYEAENQRFIQYLNEMQNSLKLDESLIISIKVQTIANSDYLILAIHDLTRSIILYYFNDHEIHQISNYSFSDYQFVHPFKYKIKLHHLAVLMKQNKNLYIAIFECNLSSLQLQEITETDDSFFIFHQSDLLYSFNKEWRLLLLNEIIVEMMTNTIFLNNLSSFYYTYLYPPQQEDRGIQLKIQILNNCYKLYSLQNLTKFEIQQNQIIKLNISDIFYGPINSLTLVTNSSITLNGPFRLREEFQLCSLNRTNFCIKQYQIERATQILMFSLIILENKIFEILNDSNENIIFITFIKLNYYLCFFKSDNNLKIQLIQCSDEYINVISDLNNNFKIQEINRSDIKRTGNLIKLKNEFIQTFIYFEDINFILINLSEIVLDVIHIENSQNQYLILQQNQINPIDIDLIIYSINLDQKILLYSLSIYKKLQIELSIRQIIFQELKLTQCIQIGNLIIIKLFIFSKQYSYIFQLILDQQKNQITFELQKSIRNGISINSINSNFKIDYSDENILVLNQIYTNQQLFYDFSQDRNFYDYFHKSIKYFQIKRFNTTHFIFINESSIHLGTIGYEIQQQNSIEINYNFLLHAQNDVYINNYILLYQMKMHPFRYIQLNKSINLQRLKYQFNYHAQFSQLYIQEKEKFDIKNQFITSLNIHLQIINQFNEFTQNQFSCQIYNVNRIINNLFWPRIQIFIFFIQQNSLHFNQTNRLLNLSSFYIIFFLIVNFLSVKLNQLSLEFEIPSQF
ncbi:unnamed protein product [Paramecium pentaurelia]|uniref:Transmembrane protein n=1 Tax=Paramecium pentaurelia TaxID=43138 RepID=A0A8S1XN85_9CILI|nr:unnamed protein product [Paramecium pentaurelia]